MAKAIRSIKMDLREQHSVQPFERFVKIGGFKWLLRKTLVTRPVRAKLYQIVMEAIETQEFAKLKKCAECSTFFVAGDSRDSL